MESFKLREYRVKANLSQRDIAEKMNISQPYYWSWEKNISLPNAQQIVDLCKILNCTPNELLGFD